MAERRMFAKSIIDSDAFLDMPVTARLLYYDLGMRADDDGFVNAPKKIMRVIGASEDDLKVLIAKKFIIPFDSGVVVIKHWRIHNYIRKDTYSETNYKEEKALLELDENKAYRVPRGRAVDEPWTQDSIGKDRLVKDSIGKDSNTNNHICHPDVAEVKAYIIEKGYHFSAESFVAHYESNGWKVGKNPMKSWKAACVTWESNYKKKHQLEGKSWLEVAEDLEERMGVHDS